MNVTAAELDNLLLELHEDLADDGFLHLYWFAVTARGLFSEASEEHVQELCHAAYQAIRHRHAFDLVWLPWPTNLAAATPTATDVALTFDIDDEESTAPLLALVPRRPFPGHQHT